MPRTPLPLTVLLLVALLAPAAAQADDETRHALGVAFGVRDDSVRDDLMVPLTFSGPGFRLRAFYEGTLGPGLTTAQADVGMAFLWNRYGHNAATLDHGAQVAWTMPVWTASTWHWAVGPALVWDSRANFFYAWDDAHIYWLGSQWLGPQIRHGRRLGENWRLEGMASFAVLGFAGRPPSYRYNKQETSDDVGYYFRTPNSNEGFVTLADLQSVRLDVAVRHTPYAGQQVGRGWSFGVDVRLTRTDVQATNINLSTCLYAARAWGL